MLIELEDLPRGLTDARSCYASHPALQRDAPQGDRNVAGIGAGRGALADDQAVWEIVDAEVFEAPIGDLVLNICFLPEENRPVVAFADMVKGTVTGALRWDWEAAAMSVIPPDRVQCVDGAGSVVDVGPGFG